MNVTFYKKKKLKNKKKNISESSKKNSIPYFQFLCSALLKYEYI